MAYGFEDKSPIKPDTFLVYRKDMGLEIDPSLLKIPWRESISEIENILRPLNTLPIDKRNENPPSRMKLGKEDIIVRYESYFASLHNFYIINGYSYNGSIELYTKLLTFGLNESIKDNKAIREMNNLLESFYMAKPELIHIDMDQNQKRNEEISEIIEMFPILSRN